MSSNRRPWYPWYPKDFVVDEKVQSLSPVAELLYRRALDVMWQANACQLPNVCQKLANQIGKGLSYEEFENGWNEIQYSGFELFEMTEDGKWLYSKRLKLEAEKIEKLQKKRAALGRKGAQAKAKAKAKPKAKARAEPIALAGLKPGLSHTDTDTDINNNPHSPPRGDDNAEPKNQKNAYTESFEMFWAVCPKKVGKDAAFRSWKKVDKRGDTNPKKLIGAMVAQVEGNHFRGNDGSNYYPNPSTWLNQGRWMDEIKNKQNNCSKESATPEWF